MQANYVQRMRFIFSKDGPARWIGHLDLARTLERAFNRAYIPVAYTQGFNRRPRMQFASALPLGYTSSYEIGDILLSEEMEADPFREQLMEKMAPGLHVFQAFAVPISGPSLQASTVWARYRATPLDPVDVDDLARRVAALLAAPQVVRVRKKKEYDLRPLVEQLALRQGADGAPSLFMQLTLKPGKNGRPDEVLDQLGFDPLDVHVHRSELCLGDQS
jgi:radical SAM-linked protein